MGWSLALIKFDSWLQWQNNYQEFDENGNSRISYSLSSDLSSNDQNDHYIASLVGCDKQACLDFMETLSSNDDNESNYLNRNFLMKIRAILDTFIPVGEIIEYCIYYFIDLSIYYCKSPNITCPFKHDISQDNIQDNITTNQYHTDCDFDVKWPEYQIISFKEVQSHLRYYSYDDDDDDDHDNNSTIFWDSADSYNLMWRKLFKWQKEGNDQYFIVNFY